MLSERQLSNTIPSVTNSVNVFQGGTTIFPLKGGMGVNSHSPASDNFVTIDGPSNCENSYYPQAYPNLIQMLNITRKELKALKAETNVSISDDGQTATISAPI